MKRALLAFVALVMLGTFSTAAGVQPSASLGEPALVVGSTTSVCLQGTLGYVDVGICMCGVNTRIILCGGGSWLVDGRSFPGFQFFLGRVVTVCGERAFCGPGAGCPMLRATSIELASCPTDAVEGSVAFSLKVQSPATHGLTVRLALSRADRATVGVYDIAGRLVRQRDISGIGQHVVELGELASSVYFVRLRQGDAILQARATLIR